MLILILMLVLVLVLTETEMMMTRVRLEEQKHHAHHTPRPWVMSQQVRREGSVEEGALRGWLVRTRRTGSRGALARLQHARRGDVVRKGGRPSGCIVAH